nr:hypothetical protein [Candidatus Sigynarchaeota archaeon]
MGSKESITFHFTIHAGDEEASFSRVYASSDRFGDILSELDDEYELESYYLATLDDQALVDDDLDKTAGRIAREFGTYFMLTVDKSADGTPDDSPGK